MVVSQTRRMSFGGDLGYDTRSISARLWSSAPWSEFVLACHVVCEIIHSAAITCEATRHDGAQWVARLPRFPVHLLKVGVAAQWCHEWTAMKFPLIKVSLCCCCIIDQATQHLMGLQYPAIAWLLMPSPSWGHGYY